MNYEVLDLYSRNIIIDHNLIFFASDRLSYNNCMAQTKSDYISEKGAEHVSAQCKAFILEQVMVK